jgi:hypothetical protein
VSADARHNTHKVGGREWLAARHTGGVSERLDAHICDGCAMR